MIHWETAALCQNPRQWFFLSPGLRCVENPVFSRHSTTTTTTTKFNKPCGLYGNKYDKQNILTNKYYFMHDTASILLIIVNE